MSRQVSAGASLGLFVALGVTLAAGPAFILAGFVHFFAFVVLTLAERAFGVLSGLIAASVAVVLTWVLVGFDVAFGLALLSALPAVVIGHLSQNSGSPSSTAGPGAGTWSGCYAEIGIWSIALGVGLIGTLTLVDASERGLYSFPVYVESLTQLLRRDFLQVFTDPELQILLREIFAPIDSAADVEQLVNEIAALTARTIPVAASAQMVFRLVFGFWLADHLKSYVNRAVSSSESLHTFALPKKTFLILLASLVGSLAGGWLGFVCQMAAAAIAAVTVIQGLVTIHVLSYQLPQKRTIVLVLVYLVAFVFWRYFWIFVGILGLIDQRLQIRDWRRKYPE